MGQRPVLLTYIHRKRLVRVVQGDDAIRFNAESEAAEAAFPTKSFDKRC